MGKNNIKIILLSLLLLCCFVAIFFTPIWGDELNYHYPNTQNISIPNIIDVNSSYSSAYTPLPYILGNIVYKINNSIFALRLFNYLIFITLIYFIYKIGICLNFDPLSLILLLISNPYLLRSSFVYYMFNYGLLFAVIGIYYYFFNTFKYRLIIAHLFFGLAVLSQQWMLIIIFSLFLNEVTLFLKKIIKKKYFFKNILYKIIFLSPALLLFYCWGGLTHPNFQAHTLKPSFEHLNGVLANLGFAGMFIALFNIKNILEYKYIPLIFILPLVWLTIPLHSKHHGMEVITGVAAQLSSQIHKFILIPYQINMFILIILGVVLVVLIISKKDNSFSYFLKYVMLGFIIAFTSSTLLGASHIFVSLPFFFLLFIVELKEDRLLKLLVITQLYLTSLFYVFYYSLFITKDMAL